MHIGIIALFVTVHISFTTPVYGQDSQLSASALSALKFFDAFASTDVHSALRVLRNLPIPVQERERARATLPSEGTLTPTPSEIKKLDALKPVLIYHERDQVFDIKVIDLPQAYIGLHERAILLISRPALKVLTAAELPALAAHELGHDFLWREFEQEPHGRARQQLELECDGIGALTLVALGQDPMQLLRATNKLNQFNKQFGTPSNIGDYPTPYDRQRFIKIVLARRHAHQQSTISMRNQQSQSAINNLNPQSTIKSISNRQSAIRNQQCQPSPPCRPLPRDAVRFVSICRNDCLANTLFQADRSAFGQRL